MAERHSSASQQVSGVGVQTAEDVRLTQSAKWTPTGQVTSRSGFVPSGAAATPGSVLATSPTPNGFVHVQPFRKVLQSNRGGGVYEQCLDAIKDINILSTSADPSNARRDLIIAQQNDAYFSDANSDFVVKQVVGTPSGSPVDPTVTGSTDYEVLARVTVPAGATSITQGNITQLASTFTVATGGLLPVADATERGAITSPYDGMQVYRRDMDWVETYDGTAWRAPHFVKTSALANITNPFSGQYAQNTTDGQLYRYTGSAWVPARGVIARGFVTTSSTAGNPTSAMRLDSVSLLAGRMYRIFTDNVNLFGTANETVSLNIRYKTGGTAAIATDAELPGARSEVKLVNGGGAAAQCRCDTVYVPGADQTVSFLVTGERNTGSNNVTVFADATSILALTVEDIGVAPSNTAVDL